MCVCVFVCTCEGQKHSRKVSWVVCVFVCVFVYTGKKQQKDAILLREKKFIKTKKKSKVYLAIREVSESYKSLLVHQKKNFFNCLTYFQ